jgi:hypothetical protein
MEVTTVVKVIDENDGGQLIEDDRDKLLSETDRRKYNFHPNGLPEVEERKLSDDEVEYLRLSLFQLAKKATESQ